MMKIDKDYSTVHKTCISIIQVTLFLALKQVKTLAF